MPIHVCGILQTLTSIVIGVQINSLNKKKKRDLSPSYNHHRADCGLLCSSSHTFFYGIFSILVGFSDSPLAELTTAEAEQTCNCYTGYGTTCACYFRIVQGISDGFEHG